MDAEEKSDNGIKTLYKEVTENHRYMVEWRHKIMVRYFLVVAAFFFIVKLM